MVLTIFMLKDVFIRRSELTSLFGSISWGARGGLSTLLAELLEDGIPENPTALSAYGEEALKTV